MVAAAAAGFGFSAVTPSIATRRSFSGCPPPGAESARPIAFDDVVGAVFDIADGIAGAVAIGIFAAFAAEFAALEAAAFAEDSPL